MMDHLIEKYKRMRTERFLKQTYHDQYAFVGMGQHSLSNLYPVLHYLGVPLKYICVTTDEKARMIEGKYAGVKGCAHLDEVLSDASVKAVLVSASPHAHFSIAQQVLNSGRSLFIEKPPCETTEELDTLIKISKQKNTAVAMAGFQKRYAPAVEALRRQIRKKKLLNYDLHYLTGSYPEGDAITDLFIHPLDLVTYLFGKSELLACRQVAPGSYVLMLRHAEVTGTLELSTAYTWTAAQESLKVCTSSGIYQLSDMEALTFTGKQSTTLGIPMEKVFPRVKKTEYLYERNQFTPTIANNQIYSQGYFDELYNFVSAVEGRKAIIHTSLTTLRDTYLLLDRMRKGFVDTE